jgi:hypothetical protein
LNILDVTDPDGAEALTRSKCFSDRYADYVPRVE